MQYLVLGATGYIGSYLYRRLIGDGYYVIGTRCKDKGDDKLLFYDIQNSNLENLLEQLDDEENKTAIICIAESNIDKCFENYNWVYDINVTKTKMLIQKLSEKGFQVIYFSSDNVFDGVSGNYTEESLTSPINKYGMMKAEMEQYILDNEPEVCILRISKVVSELRKRQNVFTEWENQMIEGKIRCIRGNRLSFVCLEDIYHVCLLVAENNLKGLYNIAGDKTYSRAELAERFYGKKGITNIDICECDVGEFLFKDQRPLNLGLSNQKFKNATGYQFKGLDSVIEQYLNSKSGV